MIEFGDCRETMRRWAEQGVKAQTCVTSPPYYGLRSYLPDGVKLKSNAAIAEKAKPESAERYKYTFANATEKFAERVAGGMQNIAWNDGIRESNGTRNKRSVWTVTTKPYSGAHFATFPPDLIEPCILAGAPVGGVALDPFMGSGTTAAVAIKNGRGYLGCELNPAYEELQQERIRDATLSIAQMSLL
jgi:DNA modification methylase